MLICVSVSIGGEKNDLLGQKDSEMKKDVGVEHEQMGRA